MTLDLYIDLRLIAATVIMTLGLSLIFSQIPNQLKGTIYETSRKVMGMATLILPTTTFIMVFTQVRYVNYNLYVLLLLTACYIFAMMVSLIFIPLLGNRLNPKSLKFRSVITSCFIFPIPLILANLYGSQQVIKTTANVTALTLMVVIIASTVGFFKQHSIAVKRVNNFYAENFEVEIHWMLHSYYLILAMQLLTCSSTFFYNIPIWIDLVLTTFRVAVFIYILVSFNKFVLTVYSLAGDRDNSIANNSEIEDDGIKNLNSEVQQHIAKQLGEWVEAKKYLKKGLTIQIVANDIYTNRTYLSSYINTTYNYSFRIWITKLRIAEAKRLLYYNRDFSIEEVASTVGFNSTTAFSLAFKQQEKVPPLKWRMNQKKGNSNLQI